MTFDELVRNASKQLAALGLDRPGDGRIASELSSRTVRFLRQADVVSRPEGAGPGAVWSSLHLQQLVTARALQAAGCSVGECAEQIRGLDEKRLVELREHTLAQRPKASTEPEIPPCPAWRITPDFTLVAHGKVSLSARQLQEIRKILTR